MKLFVVISNKGKKYLADKIYLHDGSHTDIFEISAKCFNSLNIKKKNGLNTYKDKNGNSWYFRWNGFTTVSVGGILKICEYELMNFNDVYEFICDRGISDMDKVRLLQK